MTLDDPYSSFGGAALEFEVRRLRGCSLKDRYATVAEAEQAAKRKRKEYRRRLWVYRCSFCPGYHHTSTKPRK